MLSERETLIAGLNAICTEGCWMETLHYEPTPAWEHALAEPDCPCHLLLVVLDGNRVVGWCRAFPDDSGDAAVIGIGFLDGYRDHGMGTRLLQETIQWANQLDFTYLKLRTRPDNARAIHVFEKLGFVPTGRIERGQMEMVCRLADLHRNKETEL